VQAGRAGTVRVIGTACGLGVEGSGWVAGPGTVVTNAHVVAGERDTDVQLGGEGPSVAARAVYFDARNDVAVLRAALPDGARTLSMDRSPERGTEAAILGYPGNGPFDIRAARLADTRSVVTDDAYGRGPVRRRIVAFRGLVRHGNSGGPVLDDRGRVLATVFAAASGGRRTGYGVPNDVVSRALDRAARGRTVSTGPCAG
jgi:S1-C subfamily serine protease